MLEQSKVDKLKALGRKIYQAQSGDEDLGPLQSLPGRWKSRPGHGWNMIALPFADGRFAYRLLVNQYNEELTFSLVDKAVPNRGLSFGRRPKETDQFVVTLDYEQRIEQIAADDSPRSGLAGPSGLAIHHEPGLFLHMTNETTRDLDIARLATIPHGDSVLALGRSEEIDGAPDIPDLNGLPIGVSQDLASPYLEPYKHFHDSPFEGVFDPVHPNELLKRAMDGHDIARTTILELDTAIESGGIVNIPFIVKQANAADMKSTFWIQELRDCDAAGHPKLVLQYSQVVMLDFFPRRDGFPGLIRWPHVSINTLEKEPDS